MIKRLIILRGNSGSGKTTIAKLLQEKLGRETMLLSQDTLRREILRAKENTKHPAAKMMQLLARFGWDNGYETVITEGIWGAEKNGWALKELAEEADEAFAYYFEISFDDTLRRHATKPNSHEFGEIEMRSWWKDKDFLNIKNEQIITEDMSKETVIEKITNDIQHRKLT